MRVAVTGANGLIGARVVKALADSGHEPVAVVRRGADLRGLTGLAAPVGYADLRRPDSIARAVRGAQCVVHCAALFSYRQGDEERLTASHDEVTTQVVRSAADAGVRRLVLTSSSVVFGSSPGPQVRDETGSIGAEWVPAYFRAKSRQADVARAEADRVGLELVLACPTLVLGGPSWRLVPSNAVIVRYLCDPTRTTFDGGCNVVAVDDVARGHVLLVEQGVPGEAYLLGGENVSWRTLHALVSELAGIDGPHLAASMTSAWLAASALEAAAHLLGSEPLATRDEARTLGRWYWYSSDKARALGYRPGSARAAVAGALAWLVTSPHVPRLVRESLTLAEEVYAARTLTASSPSAGTSSGRPPRVARPASARARAG
ncbi:MAG TPA: NAD-dependent epimerase/dehydratase family protein [Actinomycetes bacterium]|nr:NAD-dependent epimerase/dehydratase family protein [Actinomycetes bacterium]